MPIGPTRPATSASCRSFGEERAAPADEPRRPPQRSPLADRSGRYPPLRGVPDMHGQRTLSQSREDLRHGGWS
jgi:hypothetical protein